MDTKDLTAFKTVYEMQSINGAASALYVSPQGLSKRIHKLENDLGTPLFIRSVHGMIPTECGKMLYRNANVFTDFYEQVRKSIRDGCRELFLPLSVAGATGILSSLSVSFLLGFQKQFPDIPLKYTEYSDTDVFAKVADGDASLGIVHGPIDTMQFSGEFLFDTKAYAILPKFHPLSIRDQVSFRDFHNVPVCLLGREYQIYQQFMNHCLKEGAQPIVRLEAPNPETVYDLAIQGGTAGILSGIAEDAVGNDALPYEIRPFADSGFVQDVWVIHKRGTIVRKEAAAFLSYTEKIEIF